METRQRVARHDTGRRGSRGFTVLEVLIAFAILGVGFAAVTAVMGQGVISHRDAVDTTRAGMLAASVFDDLELRYRTAYRDGNEDGIPDGWQDFSRNGVEDRFDALEGSPAALSLPKAPGFDYSLRFLYSGYAPREVFVECIVRWNEQGAPQQLPFRRVVFMKDRLR